MFALFLYEIINCILYTFIFKISNFEVTFILFHQSKKLTNYTNIMFLSSSMTLIFDQQLKKSYSIVDEIQTYKNLRHSTQILKPRRIIK